MKAKEAKTPTTKKASTKAAKPSSTTSSATATSGAGKKKKSTDTGLKTTFGDLFKDHINGTEEKKEEEK
jgi:hypothetical protein